MKTMPFNVFNHLDTPDDIAAYIKEMEAEIERLQHDLDRHISIATGLATELEELKAGD